MKILIILFSILSMLFSTACSQREFTPETEQPNAIPTGVVADNPVINSGEATIQSINVPEQVADPYTSLDEFFASINKPDWKVYDEYKDTDPIDGKEYITVLYELGDGSYFQANFTRDEGGWNVSEWDFIRPDAALSSFLIEKAVSEILASYETMRDAEQRRIFRENQIDRVAKYGDFALDYILNCFVTRQGEGERGLILAQMGSSILGPRDNVSPGWTSGGDWYSQLSPLEQVVLPAFDISVLGLSDEEVLAAQAIMDEQEKYDVNPLTMVRVHRTRQDGSKLSMWVTGSSASFELYGTKLVQSGGGENRVFLEFENKDGVYELVRFTKAEDGSRYAPSIEAFCAPIPGLYQEMMDYEWYEDLHGKMIDALKIYLSQADLAGVYWEDYSGDIFQLS